jgi:hypothetical protein
MVTVNSKDYVDVVACSDPVETLVVVQVVTEFASGVGTIALVGTAIVLEVVMVPVVPYVAVATAAFLTTGFGLATPSGCEVGYPFFGCPLGLRSHSRCR